MTTAAQCKLRSGVIFWLRNMDPACLICEPAGSGPNHGGQHDNNCDHIGGLRRDRHDCASRGRQAEIPARLHPVRRLCVLDATVWHRHGLRPRHLCAECFGSVEHSYYGVRPEDGQYQFVLGPEHAGRGNGLRAQFKNKLHVSLNSCVPLQRTRRGIQYVEHSEGDGSEMFKAVCKLGLEGIVSKKLNAPYRSGPSKTWVKVKDPKAPAATRAIDGTF